MGGDGGGGKGEAAARRSSFWDRTGTCLYGRRCRFVHNPSVGDKEAPAGSPPKQSASEGLAQLVSSREGQVRASAGADGEGLKALRLIPVTRCMQQVKEVVALKKAPAAVAEAVMPFLGRLGAGVVAKAACVALVGKTLEDLYRIEGLVTLLHAALTGGALDGGSAAVALCWFLLRLATRCADAREDAVVCQMAAALDSRRVAGAGQLQAVLAEPAGTVAVGLTRRAGLSISDLV